MLQVYRILSRAIASIHLIIIALNAASIPMLFIYMPWYIFIPMITVLISPVIGGTFCMFNQLENYFRAKAGLPLIIDRMDAVYIFINKLIMKVKLWRQRSGH